MRTLRRAALVAAVVLLAQGAWAQSLSDAQLATLKAAILADSNLNSQPNTPDGNFEVARLLNLPASPNFIVWKTKVQIDDIGDAINSAELAGLSTLNSTRLQTLVQLSGRGVNPSLANRRAFFDDIFSGSGGTQTRAALLILWKRLATYGEKILKAGGTGTDASPATLGFEGTLSYSAVGQARNLP